MIDFQSQDDYLFQDDVPINFYLLRKHPYTYDSKVKFNFSLGRKDLRVDLGSLDPTEHIPHGLKIESSGAF